MTDRANDEIALFLKRLQWGLVLAVVFWLLWALGPILTPFVLAALLGWLGDPLVDRIERRGRSRTVAVTLVFLMMVLLLVLALLILVPMVESQIVTLIDSLPTYREWFLQTAMPWVERRTGISISTWLDPQQLIDLVRDHWEQAGGIAATFFGYVQRSGFAFIAWIVNLVLLPILTFYFLRDWDKLVERMAALVPRDHLDTVTRLARESNDVLGGFLRGQFMVMLAQGAFYAIGLQVIGLRLGILVGLIAGLISFVPYLGATVGAVLMLLAAVVQVQGIDWQLLILGGVVFTAGQLLESYVLTPRLVGDRIGLHPVAVIFAVMAGGQLFGFLGMLLALPVAAIANVMISFAQERYCKSRLYSGEPAGLVIGERVTHADGVRHEPPPA
ncbi:AI-2E family transporter [Luteimonas sp. RD2P54]|uniref:AI-2E family transporter n=1 Tax=Luteimonas endophytica TaxID=3042023 RepID=A0ABT6JB07_9GAMM|nr:AI-2E family transporter [Luteimonas endophytica]MDH5824011.1 AI-2E family transporter [Luteimonas endophytica]